VYAVAPRTVRGRHEVQIAGPYFLWKERRPGEWTSMNGPRRMERPNPANELAE